MPGTPAAPAPPSTPRTPDTPAAPAAPAARPASSQAQAKLLAVRYGAPTGDEIPLFGQRLVVGRFDPETGPVDIDLSEAAESGHISRQHGELYREADGPWKVRDLGSTNGVFVKGDGEASFGPRISAPRELKDGDEVAFGNARFIFRSS
jgi:pSer/pThr/pTyr-binding forkhead associated (FHA) protein